MKFLTCITVILLTVSPALAAGPGGVLGFWKTAGGDSLLELSRCGDKICGNIVWLKVPNYIDPVDGPVGRTKVDRKNPDPALRKQPILGLQVMKGFTAVGNRRWTNGTSYNPETGKSYKSKMYLTATDRLELRGFIGISLIGRTLVMTR
ncbi:MAG: DUF2147 domain-containing protein [Desulfuromonadaceae bacterium]|nr:DUF2147 domain-containing protein [Desulfuromonadaceae bacterium]